MWFRLMMMAFVLNGLSPFGLRVMAGSGFAAGYTSVYLVFWYLSGAFFLLLMFLRTSRRLTLTDALIGAGLGFFSVCGQSSLGAALSQGIPGNVAYPVTLAGGLFIVVLTAIAVFRERMGPAGVAGIVLGIVSIALLSVT